MNKIISLTKGFALIILFYLIQIIWSTIFNPLLNRNNILIVNLYLIGCEILLALIYFLINQKRLKKDYQDFNNNYQTYLKYGLKYWLIGVLIMIISNLLIEAFITNGIANNETINRTLLLEYPYYSVIAMAIFAPFTEELAFRLSFKEAFQNKAIFAIFTGIIFGMAHTITGITTLSDLLYLIPYSTVGISLGYSFAKTDNIYTSMIIHSIHNTLTITLLIILYTVI